MNGSKGEGLDPYLSVKSVVALSDLVGVAVVVVGAADGFEWGRCGAAVGGLAAADLELDGGVGDVEAVAQGTVNGVEDRGALGDGHLGDGDVAGERVGGRAERPAV